MRYDPIMCMMVPDTVKTHDELSLAQKKQVVTELKGYLKKSYNFSDESEYARAYEDLRHMFTTGSRKSISGLFENAVKKTGSHDSVSALDKAIKTADGLTGDKLYADVKAIYNLFSNILLTYSNEQSVQKLANEGTKKCLELAAKVKGVRDEAIRSTDGMFASAFNEYSKGAKFKKDKFLKELSGIRNAEEFAKRMQTLDNELKNNLERLDEAYNVASKDYYAARNEIRSIMDAFSREAFSLYRKLDIK